MTFCLKGDMKKLKIGTKIRKLDRGEDCLSYLPLQLVGDALTVWGEVSEADQEDEAKGVKRLMELVLFPSGKAYTPYAQQKKRCDETDDLHLVDLRWLMRMRVNSRNARKKYNVVAQVPQRTPCSIRPSALPQDRNTWWTKPGRRGKSGEGYVLDRPDGAIGHRNCQQEGLWSCGCCARFGH